MRILEPKRIKYLKAVKRHKSSCDFCNPRVINDQRIKRLEGKFWWVLASKYPYLNGNVMLVPKRHLADTSELKPSEKEEYFIVLEKAKQILGKLFKTDSFNLALNLGPESGQTITHLHWQLVPRAKFNPNSFNLLNDFWLVSMPYKELIKKINKL